ncbi:MAG: interleukin-like EMT inducer domain-containing protein [Bacteroidota bacterium]
MKRSTGELSPSISSIEIDFRSLPELGTNYQTVRCFIPQNGGTRKEIQPGDTVLQGEKIDVVYRVYNAGGVPVKNVGVTLSSQWENNTIEDLTAVVIDSLGVRTYKEYTTSYNTSLGFGRRNIRVNIDPDTTVRELYRDNNLFVFPVFVKKNQTSPVLPNLAIAQSGIRSQMQRITNEIDSARFTIVYANTGALVNDSVTIAVKHLYLGSLATEWQVRRKYPPSTDTFTVTVPILKRSGDHALQVDLDPVGLITELNETDNDATIYFTVFTTDFRIIQPSAFSLSAADRMIFLNPTSLDSTLPLTAHVQIDTQTAFVSPVSLQSPMGEFTTEFSLNSLLKNKRYYWRVKQLNSTRDWTTGSFYLGDTASFTLGQVDSAGWMSNTFERTSYDNVNGARIVDTKFEILALSAGFNDGLNGSVELNGINIIAPILGPGHNIAVIDTVSFAVRSLRRFDVSNDAAEVDSLVNFIGTIASGDIVTDVIVDDGANNLTTAARNALKTIGSARIDQLTFRDSWAIIGRKGAAIGSVPEMYKSQGSGPALTDTTIIRKESTGRIITQAISSYGSLNTMLISSQIPPSLGAARNRAAARSAIGGEITTRIVGISPTTGIDTVITSVNQSSIPMQSFNVHQYPMMQIVFDLTASSSFVSPSIQSWSISAAQPVELATSAAGASISRSSVMEGESIDFTGSVYNLSMENADSVLVRIKTLQSGIETVLKEQRFVAITARETVTVSAVFDSKGKKGNLAFMMEIDPGNEKVEVSKENNSVTIPFTVTADSIRPLIAVTIDGLHVVNGDYIGQFPEIRIRYSDNNPSMLSPADTSNFKIRLNNAPVYYTPDVAELTGFTSPGAAEIRWTPALTDGENIIQIHAADVTGNSSDTLTLFVNVASKFKLLDVYNIPNPFNRSTHFTFNLAGPVLPENVTIRIFTVAGRLIQELQGPAIIGFNKIHWDGRDRDGDEIGNGVYFYRVIVKHQEQQITATSKLVKMK